MTEDTFVPVLVVQPQEEDTKYALGRVGAKAAEAVALER